MIALQSTKELEQVHPESAHPAGRGCLNWGEPAFPSGLSLNPPLHLLTAHALEGVMLGLIFTLAPSEDHRAKIQSTPPEGAVTAPTGSVRAPPFE